MDWFECCDVTLVPRVGQGGTVQELRGARVRERGITARL